MTKQTKQILSVLGLLFGALSWGSTFILVKWAVAEIDVYYFLFLRFSLAALIMFILFPKKMIKSSRQTIFSGFILSLILGGSYLVQTEGLRHTSATNVAMITGLYLVFIPIFLFIFFRFKARVFSLIGAVVSVVGLYMLTQYSFGGFNLGDFLALLCAIGYAWHTIYTERFVEKSSTLGLVFFQFLFVAIVMSIITLGRGTYTLEISGIVWIALLITSVFASVIAIIILTASLRYIDATRAGIIFALESVFGALFAWMLGGEYLSLIPFVGACLMVTGMIISEGKPFAKYIVGKIVGP